MSLECLCLHRQEKWLILGIWDPSQSDGGMNTIENVYHHHYSLNVQSITVSPYRLYLIRVRK